MTSQISSNRAFGVTLLKPEEPGWFPSDELRAYYGLDDDHKITKLERHVFGFREDGTEGICFPTKSKDNIIQGGGPTGLYNGI